MGPNPRLYGDAPRRIALLHGGPGAPGYMAPVARELAGAGLGVVEPLQTADSLEGQLLELHRMLVAEAALPAVLVGSSWGAMLGYLFAARWPECVAKLVMIGSGVFEARYAASIQPTRLARLGEEQRREAVDLLAALQNPAADKGQTLARLGRLWRKADTYDPLTLDSDVLEHQYELHVRVWGEAERLRAGGELLERGRLVECPVVAIHGDYDPHPAEGVREPLARVVRRFRFVELARCGHLPWIERQAKAAFYRLLGEEIAGTA